MPWFRVDDGFHSHPKVLATSLAARGLWATAGSWSSDHLTDGVVPDHVLASLGGTPELAAELVTAGLWRRKRGAYAFHDFLSKNPSREAVENDRRQAAERQKRRRQRMSSRRDTGVTHGVSHTTPTLGARDTEGVTRAPAANGRAAPKRGRPAARPPWCGSCDEQTRQTGPSDQPYRCPRCHPYADGPEAREWLEMSAERNAQ